MKKLSSLSPQQRRIFFQLFTSKAMIEIARELSMSPKTLDAHAKGIYKKFFVNGRIGLILSVLEETKGKIPLDSPPDL